MKELITFFKKCATDAINGSNEDLIYLVNVFEYEIIHTSKLKTIKEKSRLKMEVYDIIKTQKEEKFEQLKALLI